MSLPKWRECWSPMPPMAITIGANGDGVHHCSAIIGITIGNNGSPFLPLLSPFVQFLSPLAPMARGPIRYDPFTINIKHIRRMLFSDHWFSKLPMFCMSNTVIRSLCFLVAGARALAMVYTIKYGQIPNGYTVKYQILKYGTSSIKYVFGVFDFRTHLHWIGFWKTSLQFHFVVIAMVSKLKYVQATAKLTSNSTTNMYFLLLEIKKNSTEKHNPEWQNAKIYDSL